MPGFRFCLFAAAAVSGLVAAAESGDAAALARLDSLAAFRALSPDWVIAGGLGGDPRRDPQLTPLPGRGVLVCNPAREKSARRNLVTAWEHGDVDLTLEFLLSPKSNSGLYLQGRYEVQLLDSWGVLEPKYRDCGGIYQRWDPSRGQGREGYEGRAPRVNACREPGVWQQLRIVFLAPRFDAAGRKTVNARFARVELNGVLIHENVEVTGPTRAPLIDVEVPSGPLMIQGDHGPVALRKIAIRFPTKDSSAR